MKLKDLKVIDIIQMSQFAEIKQPLYILEK